MLLRWPFLAFSIPELEWLIMTLLQTQRLDRFRQSVTRQGD
jgi:hypothetical protein